MKKSVLLMAVVSTLSMGAMLHGRTTSPLPSWFIHAGRVAPGEMVAQMIAPCGFCAAQSSNPIARMWHLYDKHTNINKTPATGTYTCSVGHTKKFNSIHKLVGHINSMHSKIPAEVHQH